MIDTRKQGNALIGNASVGDIVKVNMSLTPENGFVPESLFDTNGEISFILGWGNYLPGFHELVQGLSPGDNLKNVSIDAGWGKRNPKLVIDVPKTNFKQMKSIDTIKEGAFLKLQGGIEVSVLRVSDDTITVDANPPLAGSSYACSVDVISVDRFPKSKLQYHDPEFINDESPYEVATWAMGCFWGGELAFMRVNGVVGTKVGYTQGVKENPTYDEVCNGETKHREAVMVIYDPKIVSYSTLVKTYMERLKSTVNQYKVIDLFEEEDSEPSSYQYQHGIYYHNEEQRTIAQAAISENGNQYDVEMKKASVFYDAEEYHQQYLLKGGQSARKGAKEAIRCFG